MPKEKITYEQFFAVVDPHNQPFVQAIHDQLAQAGCKIAFEPKAIGFMASYKYGKPPKAFLNFVFRKHGMLARIYGECIAQYPEFLQSLPPEMTASIHKAGDCARLINDGCSPKCTGYDFHIGDTHFQKCRYSCFEFLVSPESKPYIQKFIELELKQRQQ
ncbi:MAG: hypothetical protein FWC71_03735 [Defluviitaleaceae bacterium]|nr:hypothetical protein [Defluviitaleaceae bacterium]